MSKLPNYLRRYRRRSGLSQSDVAFLLGCLSSSKTCRYERNTRLPTLQTAFAYEAIFKTPMRDLFGGMYQRAEKDVIRRAIRLQKTIGEHARFARRKAFIAALTRLAARESTENT